MSGRIRVRQTISFQKPDLIPVEYGDFAAHGDKRSRLCTKYAGDFSPLRRCRSLRADPNGSGTSEPDCRTADEWGTVREPKTGAVCGCPLSDWETAESYRFPPLPAYLTDRRAFMAARGAVGRRQQRFFHMESCDGLFARLTALRPLPEVCRELETGDPRLLSLLDRLTDYYAALLEGQLRLGVDGICFRETLFDGEVPLLSPAALRILLPRYRRLTGLVHQAGAVVQFRQDGQSPAFLAVLKELGADAVLLQPTAADAETLALLCRQLRLAAALQLDGDSMLRRCTPEEVRRLVQTVYAAFRPDLGGSWFYIPADREIPFLNLQTLVETVYRLRQG